MTRPRLANRARGGGLRRKRLNRGPVPRPSQLGGTADRQVVGARRSFLLDSACGLGGIALASLFAEDGLFAADPDPMLPRDPHFAPTAKSVIFLFQSGGPSQLDLFDHKPSMRRWDGQALPPTLAGDLELAFIQPTPRSGRAQGNSTAMATAALRSQTCSHTRLVVPTTSASCAQ